MFYQNSTAKNIINKLKKSGVEQQNFKDTHLLPFYRRLKPYKDKADFTSVQHILPLKVTSSMITPTSEAPYLGVIIETREHPLLAQVVVDYVEKTQCKVQLFHGLSNLKFILSSAIYPLIQEGQVVLTEMGVEGLRASSYNALLLSPLFWEQLLTRNKVFIFQTDAMLCHNSNYQLEDFLNFDYIGSWWQRLRPIGIIIDGGNGGFSIRDWHKSTECLERFSPTVWPGGEDGYFAFHIELIGGKVAKRSQCSKFGTQEKFSHKSFGCHKISCLNNHDRHRFLKYFPQSIVLLQEP